MRFDSKRLDKHYLVFAKQCHSKIKSICYFLNKYNTEVHIDFLWFVMYSFLMHWKDYDYVVINDDLETCFKEISSLIENTMKNSIKKYDKRIIEEHIKKLTS